MKRLKRVPMNVFTFLVIAAAVSLVFRAVNIVTFDNGQRSAVTIAQAQQGKTAPAGLTATNAEPPPLTAADIGAAKNATAAAKTTAETAASPTQTPAVPADTSFDNRSFSSSEIEILQTLSKRRDDLDKREQQLSTREALVFAAEKEMENKIEELSQLRDEIENLLGKQEKMETDRIVSLVRIYENMKPKEAATIFNTLDMKVLLPVISRMNERRASPILAAMDPDKARIVTIKLAEMRKLPAAPTATPAPQGGGVPLSLPATPPKP